MRWGELLSGRAVGELHQHPQVRLLAAKAIYFYLMPIFLSLAKRPKSQWSSTPFGRMVEAAGLVLSGGEEANELSTMQNL